MIENKKPNGFMRIINSTLDPVECEISTRPTTVREFDERRALKSLLLDPTYLVGLMQKAFLNENDYNPEKERWENVSPKAYKEAMSRALETLDAEITAALEAAQAHFDNETSGSK